MKRRSFTAGLLAAAAAGRGARAGARQAPAGVGAQQAPADASRCQAVSTGGISAADFQSYIAAFNRSDFDGFARFYAHDIEFHGQGGSFRGRDALVAFYRQVKSRVRETITVRSITQDESDLVADLVTELQAVADWPEFPTGALRAGEIRHSENFVWYQARNGEFTCVRSAHYRSGAVDESDAVASTGGSASRTEPSAAGGTSQCAYTMPAERFQAYIEAFNRDDYHGFGDYYDENVTLTIAGRKELRGRQAIFDFYRDVKRQTHRTIVVDKLIRAPGRVAAELHSEFVAVEDSPDFIAGALKTGQRIFIRTFVLYELRGERFARIRSAEYRKLARP